MAGEDGLQLGLPGLMEALGHLIDHAVEHPQPDYIGATGRVDITDPRKQMTEGSRGHRGILVGQGTGPTHPGREYVRPTITHPPAVAPAVRGTAINLVPHNSTSIADALDAQGNGYQAAYEEASAFTQTNALGTSGVPANLNNIIYGSDARMKGRYGNGYASYGGVLGGGVPNAARAALGALSGATDDEEIGPDGKRKRKDRATSSNMLGQIESKLDKIIDILGDIQNLIKGLKGKGGSGIRPMSSRSKSRSKQDPDNPFKDIIAALAAIAAGLSIGAIGDAFMKGLGDGFVKLADLLKGFLDGKKTDVTRPTGSPGGEDNESLKDDLRNKDESSGPSTRPSAVDRLRNNTNNRMVSPLRNFGNLLRFGATTAVVASDAMHGYKAYQDFTHGDSRGGINELVHAGGETGEFLGISKMLSTKKTGPMASLMALPMMGYEHYAAEEDIHNYENSNLSAAEKQKMINARRLREEVSDTEIGVAGAVPILNSLKFLKGKKIPGLSTIAGAAFVGGSALLEHAQESEIDNDSKLSLKQKEDAKGKLRSDLAKNALSMAGGLAGMWAGAEGGAALGAGIGSIVPGVGNIVGAGVGGAVGGIVGGFVGDRVINDHFDQIKKFGTDTWHGVLNKVDETSKSMGIPRDAGRVVAGSLGGPLTALPALISALNDMTHNMSSQQRTTTDKNGHQITINMTNNNPNFANPVQMKDVKDQIERVFKTIASKMYNDTAYSSGASANGGGGGDLLYAAQKALFHI